MKIAVLLSGGVDSSVALSLLRQEGHEVAAFYLKVWLEDELAFLGECPWQEDLSFARAVCEAAAVPLAVVSLQREYHRRVVARALAELAAGRTPSPDILCNEQIKFGAFLDHLEDAEPGFDRVASGHYARLRQRGGDVELWKGVDPVKDQTYFLYRLSQRQLRRCLFPLGGYRKAEVRRLARGFALPNRARKDSQGICFLGKIDYDGFVRGHLGESPGEIRRLEDGRVLGEHRGFWFHTIGQRRGLGLSGGPWYVVAKDVDANAVYVSHRESLARCASDRFRLTDLCWIGSAPRQERLEVKIRHSPQTFACRTVPRGDGLEVVLERPDPGVAAGQAAVLYDGDRCFGGGTIVPADPGVGPA